MVHCPAMRSAWLLVSCLTATVLVASALVSALVTFYTSALPAAVTSELPKSGPIAVAVSGVTGGGQSAAGVAERMSASFRTVPTRVYPATWSSDLTVPMPPQHGQVPVVRAASVSGISASARLTAGSWPAGPAHWPADPCRAPPAHPRPRPQLPAHRRATTTARPTTARPTPQTIMTRTLPWFGVIPMS